MDRGVWNWTRHPNYMGEITLWWGIYALCVSPATHEVVRGGGNAALKASVVGPIFITLLLLFASGVPTAEKPTAKKYYLMSHGAHPESGDKWADYKVRSFSSLQPPRASLTSRCKLCTGLPQSHVHHVPHPSRLVSPPTSRHQTYAVARLAVLQVC